MPASSNGQVERAEKLVRLYNASIREWQIVLSVAALTLEFEGSETGKKKILLPSGKRLTTFGMVPPLWSADLNFVGTGELDPNHIHTPCIYVQRLIQGTQAKRIETVDYPQLTGVRSDMFDKREGE